mgnify:CR=1 FL=1
MLNEKQIERMLGKLAKFEEKLGTMLFDKVDELPMLRTEECGPLDAPPADDAFRPFADGETWGGEGKYCWLKGCYTVPQELDGKTLFLAPKSTFYEAMLWVDGQPFGTFCNKIVIGSHGNHYCDMIAQNVHAGQTIDIAMEMYTWHYLSGNGRWKNTAISASSSALRTSVLKTSLSTSFILTSRPSTRWWNVSIKTASAAPT